MSTNYWTKYNRLLVLVIFVCITVTTHAQPKNRFTYNDSVFLLNGKPFQMISGEIHYPRVPQEAWRHRMKMAKAMGINTKKENMISPVIMILLHL